MIAIVSLYSDKKGEITRFLNKFYNTNSDIENDLKWEKKFNNPIEIAEIVGAFIDNKEDYQANMWVSIDKGVFINITENNANMFIKYLYERFPY